MERASKVFYILLSFIHSSSGSSCCYWPLGFSFDLLHLFFIFQQAYFSMMASLKDAVMVFWKVTAMGFAKYDGRDKDMETGKALRTENATALKMVH